jgi:uncharacterized protein (DUF2147 family)
MTLAALGPASEGALNQSFHATTHCESDRGHLAKYCHDSEFRIPAQEVMMRTFFALAFLMASSAAQAQYTFDYGGRTIRIDPDRGTLSIQGVYDNTGRPTKRSHHDGDRPRKQPPQQAKVDPQTPDAGTAPPEQAPAPANTSTEPPAATANIAPVDSATQPPTPQVEQGAAAVAKSAPAPVVATAPIEKQPDPAAVTPVQSANTPLGLWLTEEKEGKVRIEQCGANLCGYAVDAKSNGNGEQILINMKPGTDAKWRGRIHDPKSGSNYDSTIALKSPDALRVQGCAFGGMFCGGQTWSRLN